ncbi:ABC-F family ATP-binding cassette domain-containing protein [Parvibium lacunae]|uniref:Probable ATP-binding protein YheS n=1 Tax=Parvibium lacunae TaxID=1888893 RepID=A0A368L7G1_9BURK|nr:ATP-binding cassette domain-containing protein [Parvibium lacunae]RCS59554.1 ATP-binding cassette domain-containing protein [Parvibium lacunae]
MLRLTQLTLRRGTKVLLQETNATLNPGERVGIVGANGAGKSTLFALLRDEIHADGGDATLPPHWRVSHVLQETPGVEQPALDYVLDGDVELRRLQAALSDAEAADDGHAMGELHSQLADAGAYDAHARAATLLLGLGFRVEQLSAPVASFSGGWRMRLNLARALLCPSDLLLLDEPTNHLDIEAILWLGDWLKRYPGTVLVISHDREFLDTVIERVWHLDQQRITEYRGNYTDFVAARAERQTQQQAAYSRQQEHIAKLNRFIDRFKAKASKAKQAQSRVKALEKLERVAPIQEDSAASFSFADVANSPSPMLVMEDVACGYTVDDHVHTILQPLSISLVPEQRIGLLGINGAGKSTFIQTLTGDIAPLSGQMRRGKGLQIGYFAQHQVDTLRANETPLQHLVRLAPTAREQDLRSFLGRFRFSNDSVFQAIETMSGGERARLALALIAWQKPNLLVLDEPTNHLDLDMRQALATALAEFAGTVVLVSHDRALLESTVDEYWVIQDGKLQAFEGDLDDYRRWRQEQLKQAEAKLQATPGDATATDAVVTIEDTGERSNRRAERQATAAQRQALAVQRKPLEKAMAQLDKKIAQQQTLLHELEANMAAPEHLADGKKMAEWAKQHGLLRAELDALEVQWLEVAEQLEAINLG